MPEHNIDLHLACLTPEQKEKTCGYWYTVTSNGMAHTAFRTKAALFSWLHALDLHILDDVPVTLGEHAWMKIHGQYRREWGGDTPEAFQALPGVPVCVLSNGGVRVIYVPNPNCKWRDTHNHRECDAMKDAGITVL